MEHPLLRRVETHFAGAHGHSLFQRAWLPPDPEHVLVLAHGWAEHSGRYEHLGAWFAARGCAVYAYDQQGHGRTSGPRAHVRRFDDLLDDLEILLQRARQEHLGLPVHLVGHSMGGLVVATFARERKPDVASAITSGAMLAPPPSASRGRTRAARWLRRLLPRLSVSSGIDPGDLSRDPEVVRAYVEDPLVPTRLTLSSAAELFGALERTAAAPEDVRVPMLLMHGEDDALCPAAGSRAFHDRLTAGGRLLIYPGLRHEIFNEPERERVFEDLLEWVREGPASG